jgi:hypothetical protein
MSKAAKHAEIARRYAWNGKDKARRQTLPDRLAAVARAELWRFFHDQTGGKLSRVALEQHITAKLGEGWQSCSKVEIAHRIGLTLSKRMQLDIRRFPATDVTRDQQKAAYAARRKWKDGNRRRESRRRKMEAISMSSDLSERKESLFLLLKASGKAMDVAEIADAVKDFAAWQCPDGSRMTRASLESRVREELDSLASDPAIRQERKPTKRGFRRTAKWAGTNATTQQRGGKTVRTQSTRMESALSRGVLKNGGVSAQDSSLTARTLLVGAGSGLPTTKH